MSQPERLTAGEAWQLVKKAINGPHVHYGPGGWDYSEAFNLLPPDVQRVLGSPSRLREYANMDEREFTSWEAPRFMRSFDARQAKQIEYEKLPASVRNIAAQIANHNAAKMLEAGG